MKRATIAKTFAITVAAALALSVAPKALSLANQPIGFGSAVALALRVSPTAQADDDVCSDATLKGAFAFTSTGSITAPPPLAGAFAIVGSQTFDGKGAFKAAATVSQNGHIIPVTMTGTYKVESDCTGALTAQISPVGITTHLFLVIDHNGKEFRAIQTDPGVVVTGIGRRQ